MGVYDVAQICINGHDITSMYNSSPEFRADYCDRCGEKTITNCTSCNKTIRGNYSTPGIITFNSYSVPSFCQDCGNPYPWTETLLENAVEIVALDDELSDEQKEILKNSFRDLILDTPTTPVAVAKYRKHIESAQKHIKNSLKDLLFKAVSDTVKKTLWG